MRKAFFDSFTKLVVYNIRCQWQLPCYYFNRFNLMSRNVTMFSSVSIPLCSSFILSVISYFIVKSLIPGILPLFLKAGLFGIDLCKKNSGKIPEAAGVISGCIFLISILIFIPIPFGNYIINTDQFPHNEFAELLAALLSICCMLLLGFADDVLDLRWRHKLLLPTIASLPLLVVYYVNFNSTTIIVPIPLRELIGTSINIGVLYYIYMGMLAVFCTNAINILAGINGLEVGQSVVIALSIIIFNIIELNGEQSKAHIFSLYIMLPYLTTTMALLKYNWYPSSVFVGDTFCYLSGMTFAVVGILGHFSKTVLLFFIPQVINFLYSVPQLFHIIPCPRHRLPKFNPDTEKLETSKAIIDKSGLGVLGKLILSVFKKFKIIEYKETQTSITVNNFTLINYYLVILGPQHEVNLTMQLITFQVVCSIMAFIIRYPLASLFYDSTATLFL